MDTVAHVRTAWLLIALDEVRISLLDCVLLFATLFDLEFVRIVLPQIH